MAFPLPQHLPRAGFSGESSSFGSTSSHAEPFLKRIASHPLKDFKHASATAWLKDLDKAVADTKERIHGRINSDLAQFENQLESSRQAQTRLKSLSTSVEDLDDALNSAQTGLLPGITSVLQSHSTLAQDAMDADARSQVLSHLLKCRNVYRQLASLASEGRLPEAIQHYEGTKDVLDSIGPPLSKARVTLDMRRKFRVLVDRIQEQLAAAYQKGVSLETSATGATFSVAREVPVGSTTHRLALGDVMTALPGEDLERRLVSLRKDIIQKLVTPVLLRGSATRKTSEGSSDLLEIRNDTPNANPLLGLETILRHIHQSLLPSLPTAQRSAFSAALYQPVAESIISSFLRPSIPSSIVALPAFLLQVTNAVKLDQVMREELGFRFGKVPLVAEWASEVGSHYEKRRREAVILAVRELIEDPRDEDRGVGVRVKETIVQSQEGSDVASASPSVGSSGVAIEPPATDSEEGSGWDFDDTPSTDVPSFTTAAAPASEISEVESTEPQPPDTPANPPEEEEVEDGWGFDDDIEPTSPPPPEDTESSIVSSDAATGPSSADQGDGWGFEDDQPQSPVLSLPTPSSAKPARGLEKFSARHEPGSAVSGSSSGVVAAPVNLPVPTISSPPRKKVPERPREQETYLVSSRAVKVLTMAGQTLAEGKQLLGSDIFGKDSPRRGQLLLTAVPSILDLYRALYPIAHAETLNPTLETGVNYSATEAMQFSNDCKYLSQEGQRLEREVMELDAQSARTKLGETDERLKVVSETWFDDTLDREIDGLEKLIAKSDGFTESGDDDKFEQYRATVERVLDDIIETSRSWKAILTRTAYLHATGALVDDILARMIEDIISLPDIPELESHRLNDLLKVLNPLEGLFSEGENSSVVMHVPLWLKFSYLAELLEASMNDISYLFDEGALIDFTVDELIRLVRALFADTPLRARTIEKISAGHPLPSY